MPIFRASKGLIVAQLTNRGDYATLVEQYRAIVKKSAGNFHLPQFEALVKDLASCA